MFALSKRIRTTLGFQHVKIIDEQELNYLWQVPFGNVLKAN